MTEYRHRNNLLGTFAQHRVAANLFMIIMILSGTWALQKLNIQFFPSFTLELINVRMVWRGASAEDMEDGITNRIEEALRTQEGLRKISSTSAEGISSVTLEYESGTDMSRALDQVKEQVALIRDLPADAEEPEITRPTAYERVASVIIWSESDQRALRPIVHRFEQELLDRGISRVEMLGLPEQEIAIELSIEDIHSLGLTLEQAGDRIASLSREAPAGNINKDFLSQQLRSPEQLKTADDYANIPITQNQNSIRLGDLAQITRRNRDKSIELSYQGKPAVELTLMRIENEDSLEAAETLQQWYDATLPTLPQGVGVKIYDQRWQYIKQRIDLLLRNGVWGLILVITILFVFLRGPVAFWVAVGVPVSFMAALTVLYVAGGSVNMISLFGLIMALGIIVDDAIVVGEDAMTHYQRGETPLSAAEGGAARMLVPVISSSLTTVAAFVPLMILSGHIGKLLFALPMVIICVIIASLIESFLILPGHLRHTFERLKSATHVSDLRQRIETNFENFREHRFRGWVEHAISHPLKTVGVVASVVIFTIGLFAGGRMDWVFLPPTESSIVNANIRFVPGTPRNTVSQYLNHVERALEDIGVQHPELIQAYTTRLGQGQSQGHSSGPSGDQYANLRIELSASDTRDVRNPEFIKMIEDRLPAESAIEELTIASRQAGPQGRDLTLQLNGQSAAVLKQAAEEVKQALRSHPAVFAVTDDMPYGQQQLVFELSAQGKTIGITTSEIGRQLRAAYDGYLLHIFQDGRDEIEVRTTLKREQQNDLTTLEAFPIVLSGGEIALLGDLVEFKSQRGFETLRHDGGQLMIEISADVNAALGNASRIMNETLENTLPGIAEKYNVHYQSAGQSSDQAEIVREMMIGSLYALALIYLILAWVFSSYGWPLLVMIIIPFAIIGALFGHWLTGQDVTLLSLFGLFGLSGIVINDSIILVTFYRHLRKQGMAIQEAIVEASVQRMRAVLLTSLTTVAGLLPILLETSLQAQFLIPMATSIAFGLIFSTGLVLFMVPLLLRLYEGRFSATPD